ncbi:MAG: hypothetical protein K2Y71_29555 [Xanthobacteraceae bacterium]|nr:hypothetical protein [Xanthobacteraceae bacterium]
MRMITVIAAALATLSVVAPASAQMSASTRAEMAKMRAANPTSYDACYSLATQRGYSTNDQEHEGRAIMNFISGCMAMSGKR